ncbi:hypothetical protein GCM10009117_24140 [Gangjinia marincola]|uniref:DUF4331 domain-containing protein n=1 Tax=Gangjinia marincola TaxID=578463 RepID=A0ABN1MJW4_9FLAO
MKNILYTYVLIAAAALTLTSCGNDDDVMMEEPMAELDFSGTFSQEDQMGRPGINTVLSGTSADKDLFNLTIPSEQTAIFQPKFLDRAVALHAAFGVEYETNILNLDATTLTTILATDVLQVAPDGPTTYFGGLSPETILTGRKLTDDVIDVSLILLFGGETGDRFNGQDTDNDGEPNLPILVTDNVNASGETPLSSFPYLENPHN